MTKITPLGDSALIVHLAESFEEAPEKTLSSILQAMRLIGEASIPGIVELAPSYTSVAAFLEPLRAIEAGANVDGVFDWLGERIHAALRATGKPRGLPGTKPVDIPVCYEAEFAFDMNEIARQTRRSPEEIVDLHCGGEYLVHCVGFTPGFPYLSGLPNELVVPRRSSPRKDVTAGSVAIAGKQTGIYPLNSPGGWNVIGRTPLRLFDPASESPSRLRAGDRVRFLAISREEFETFAE